MSSSLKNVRSKKQVTYIVFEKFGSSSGSAIELFIT